jgi:integrase
VAQPHVRPIIQFALLTGCRRGEILGLTWNAVDLKGRRIHLRYTKNGEARVLPMGDDLKALLEALPRHVSHNHVFTYWGRPIKSLQGSWEDAREKAGLEHVHFHDLRHTWASRQVAAGTDLYLLMKLGGWKSVSMVQRYAHFAPDYLQTAANRLNGTAGTAVPVELVATLVASQ